MTRASEVEIILLFLTIPHDVHNCCVASFQRSLPLMRRMAFLRSALLMYIHRLGGRKKEEVTRPPS